MIIQPRKKRKPPKKAQARNQIPVVQPDPKKRVVEHPKYGTSKLEEKFAKEFLDKLGVKYVYQFEAKDIGRFFDFFLPDDNCIIEIDGDFWHGNPDKYKEEELRPHQKRAQRIDEHKTKWALMRGIPIIRFWESDINNNPIFVMQELREKLKVREQHLVSEEKNKKRQVNKLKPQKPLKRGTQLLLFK